MSGHDLISLDEMGISLTGAGDAWQPTPHGMTLARVLYERPELVRGKDVLELGAGLAVHTILIERAGAKSVTATEIKQEFLDATKANMEANGCGGDTRYVVADWLNLDGEFDLIVANPPFAQSGKQNRRYFTDDLILNAHKRLRSGGQVLFVQSSMTDIALTREMLDRNGFDVEFLFATSGPFRDYYYDDPTFMEEIQGVKDGYKVVDGKEWETLHVLLATLRDFTPPPTAHAVD